MNKYKKLNESSQEKVINGNRYSISDFPGYNFVLRKNGETLLSGNNELYGPNTRSRNAFMRALIEQGMREGNVDMIEFKGKYKYPEICEFKYKDGRLVKIS